MGAAFVPLVLETHGRFHADFTKLLKRLAIQVDGLTAREMALIIERERRACCASEEPGLEGLVQAKAEACWAALKTSVHGIRIRSHFFCAA